MGGATQHSCGDLSSAFMFQVVVSPQNTQPTGVANALHPAFKLRCVRQRPVPHSTDKTVHKSLLLISLITVSGLSLAGADDNKVQLIGRRPGQFRE
jgi:hypothetical protein